jgi:hypothetical protein
MATIFPKKLYLFPYNLKVLEDYAKKKGMLGYSQAVEHLAKKTRER